MTPEEKRTVLQTMNERFHKDALVSIATVDGDIPYVRTVNGYYEDGNFYIITYALSRKIKQIEKNPNAALCAEWFTGLGTGENLGYIGADQNKRIAKTLKEAFSFLV